MFRQFVGNVKKQGGRSGGWVGCADYCEYVRGSGWFVGFGRVFFDVNFGVLRG